MISLLHFEDIHSYIFFSVIRLVFLQVLMSSFQYIHIQIQLLQKSLS